MNQFLKIGKYLLVALSILFFTASNSYAGWHSTTQADRNQKIVIQAQHDLGLVGGACKVWAYDVVRVASYYAGGPAVSVYLPLTDNNGDGYAWVNDGTGNAVSSGALAPASMTPGMIIQMRIHYANGTYGPHTAIVKANSVGTQVLTFLESNYSTPYTVTERTVSYSAFLASIEPTSHYTVYTIH